MMFTNDFEFEASNGEVFFVSVDGEKFIEDGQMFTEINNIEIVNEADEVVDEAHVMFAEIKEEAVYRDYEIEIHSRDFDYYETNTSSLGKDRFDF